MDLSRISNSGCEFFQKMVLNGEPKLTQKVCHKSDPAGKTVSKDPEDGKAKAVAEETSHGIGEDAWYTVGFHLVAAVNTAFILGYPALIMAKLGWIAGTICLVAGGAISFYNNCLLGELHETGGKRHVRYRDLAGHIYGRHMYRATWLLQYSYLFVANVGTIVLGGESLKAIATSHTVEMALPGWVGVAGAVTCMFAFLVPTLHALRFISACSLLLSCTYTFIGAGSAFFDGLKANGPRDYSLKGTPIAKTFNAMGALAITAFAFNTGILPEMQATVREPAIQSMKKALVFQFSAGTVPIVMLTFVGYWAYGNGVAPYMLNSVSGPKSVVTIANVAAFLQTIVSLHIYCSPIYEFMDTWIEKKGCSSGSQEWSSYGVMMHLMTRASYIALSTLLGALLPFFGGFIALTAALAAFPLESALVHHMYLTVKGKDLGIQRRAWHWGMVVFSVVMMLGTITAGFRSIVVNSMHYHAVATT